MKSFLADVSLAFFHLLRTNKAASFSGSYVLLVHGKESYGDGCGIKIRKIDV